MVKAAFSTALGLGLLVGSSRGFVLPVPSLVESTGNEIAARRALRATQRDPSPRMTTASPSESRTTSTSVRTRGWEVDSIVSRLPQKGLKTTGVQPIGNRGPERTDGRSPDFEVNLGRVIDTLRNDYPRLFFDTPSFDIFTDDIELRDPVSIPHWRSISRADSPRNCGAGHHRPSWRYTGIRLHLTRPKRRVRPVYA